MNSKTMTLSKFFQDYYIIPDYQRGYSWQDKQIEDFWEDITSACEKGVNHYFGTVYLKFNCVWYRKKYYDVIDGQQRLTTLFALLKILGIDELIKKKMDQYIIWIIPIILTEIFLLIELLKETDKKKLLIVIGKI